MYNILAKPGGMLYWDNSMLKSILIAKDFCHACDGLAAVSEAKCDT